MTGKQLLYNYPKFYAHNLPESFYRDNLNVVYAINGSHVRMAPWNNLGVLTSSAGQQFFSFAKYTTYGQGKYFNLLTFYDSVRFFTFTMNWYKLFYIFVYSVCASTMYDAIEFFSCVLS